MKKKNPEKANGKKGGRSDGLSTGELAHQLATANAIVMSNMAEAAIAGYTAFATCVTDQNADKPGFENGLFQGAVNGWFAALLASWNSAPQSVHDLVDEILTGRR